MLQGRSIVVTGAARGLGREIALAIGEAGGRVIVADVDEAGGNDTVTLLNTAGHDGRFYLLDLSDPVSIEQCANQIGQQETAIHGLVNNGAIATGIGGKRFDEIEIDTWDRVMSVNVRGQWLMIRHLAPVLEQSPDARIVNVASDTALWGAPNLLSYVASKGAIISMTRSLARELGDRSIGVSAVAPGILTTESTEYVPEERHQHYEAHRAVQGPQAPEDITGTIVFLLTREALALTGQTLPTNRGFVYT